MSSLLLLLAYGAAATVLFRHGPAAVGGVWRQPSARGVLLVIVGLPLMVLMAWIGRWALLPCGLGGCNLPKAVSTALHRTVVVDRDGDSFGVLEREKGLFVPIGRFSAGTLAAVTSAEDRRFWDHSGVDWIGVMRAAWSRLVRGSGQGASTIAMQAAQLVLGRQGAGVLPPDGTWKGKIAETSVGYRLIETLGHDGVLELYLNEVPLGPVVGFEAAARKLFGIGASELDLGQAATLSAMIRAPSVISPRRDARLARQERNRVLSLLARNQSGLRSQAEWATGRPLSLSPQRRAEGGDFLAALRREVGRNGLPTTGEDTIRTTFDPALDLEGRAQLTRVIAQVERGLFGDHRPEKGPLQGMVLALSFDGSIRAYVSGRPDEVPLRWDRIAEGRVRLASTIKPILLAAALEEGLVKLTDPLSELEALGNPDLSDPWVRRIRSRANRDLAVADALARSENWLAVLLWELLPAEAFARMEADGVLSISPAYPVEAMGLETVSPLGLAAVYASFGNGGTLPTPRFMAEREAPRPKRIWTERTARMVSRGLEGVVDHGTAWRAKAFSDPSHPLAGKTGTVDGSTELVMVGFNQSRTDPIVTLMWLGFDLPERIAPGAEAGRVLSRPWAETTVRVGQGGGTVGSTVEEFESSENER